MRRAGGPEPAAGTAAAPGAPRARRVAVGVWLLGCALAVVVAARTSYVADLSAFLPAAPTRGQGVLLEELKSGVASRLLLIGIEGGDAPMRAAASKALASALRAEPAFDAVANGDSSAEQGAGPFLFAHRYLLSPAVDAERFTVDGLRAAIDDTLALLGTPAGALVKPVLTRDPTGETVRIAEAMLPAHAPRIDDGVWVSRQAPRAVLVATTRAPGSDLDAQARAQDTVRAAFAPQAARGLRLELAGAPVFAVASRAQIRSEARRLALAGSVLVLGLLLAAFRRIGPVAIAVLPVATGVLAGIAAVSLTFGTVHAMTIGFGTTLIGEAVDYAIYYLVQARHDGAADGASAWLRTRWPTVRLGLLTSLCGFAALLLSGFPGLAQLGLYSIAGLVAAALTTRWVLTVIAPHGAVRTAAAGVPRGPTGASDGRWTQRAVLALPRTRVAWRVLAIAAALFVLVHPSPWRGDITALSPVDPALVRLDAALRADVGAPDVGTLVAVTAGDLQGALEGAQAAGQRLDALVDAGLLDGYESPARLLPPVSTQLARRAALPDAATLTQRLEAATRDGPLPGSRLRPFVDDVQAARAQTPVERAALDGTPLAPAVDALLARDGPRWRAFLHLQPGTGGVDLARVKAALGDAAGIDVIAVKPELDALYAHYLHEATWQALAGAGAVVVLLAWRLRAPWRLLRVLAPLAAALVLVLAALTLAGTTLGILHLVGLLLVVAIGSNYALFFDHLGEAPAAEPAHDTLASLVLANATTVVSFGLLALSGIPVLQAIGRVVAPATLLCLVLSAAWIPPRREAHGTIPAP
jgi:predicted exporter